MSNSKLERKPRKKIASFKGKAAQLEEKDKSLPLDANSNFNPFKPKIKRTGKRLIDLPVIKDCSRKKDQPS